MHQPLHISKALRITMPNYQYECVACGSGWEEIQGYHDEPRTICIVCHTTEVRRVFSLGHISVKGNNTLGAIAEANRKNLGGEYDNIVQRMANERSSTFKGKIPDGASQVHKKKGDRPMWRPDRDTPDFGILKANDEQITKYVMEGKRPIGT
jgi:putative FmdB family regulatory protein